VLFYSPGEYGGPYFKGRGDDYCQDAIYLRGATHFQVLTPPTAATPPTKAPAG
jgi:hypothetical protein